MSWWRRPEVWVFAILFGSYAAFWQARDWNSASRLMLTYALVDRGTVVIDGLEDQTGDRAFFHGHYYSDKLPGFSLAATLPYALAKRALGFPDHPLNRPGFAYWPADWWVTLGTSGLCTALTAVVLVRLAAALGAGPRRAALVGLAFGLATPAYAYATMAHSHPLSSFALLAAFALLWHDPGRHPALRAGAGGFFASYAAVVELQVGPVSAVLGLYLLALVLGGRRKVSTLGDFAVGAVLPALVLLGYNQLAFGSPFDMGYFHHATREFANVHSEANPLGLRAPDLSKVVPLLFGRYRGLVAYAPVTALVPLGLVALARRRLWGVTVVSLLAMGAVFLVNLSYPEWTGGWCTGPRLLTPLLPFALLAVAGFVATGRRWAVALTMALAVAGGVLMLLFVGVGGHVSQDYPDPLFGVVLPLWRGERVAGWIGPNFARNLASLAAPGLVDRLPAGARGLQLAPLVLAQALGIAGMLFATRSDLRVDQQEQRGGQHEDAQNPGAEPQRVQPDPGPGLVPGRGVDEADGDHQR